MDLQLTADEVRQLRLRAQRLAPAPGEKPADTPDGAVRQVLALQAQELPAALLGAGLRGQGFDLAAVERVRQEKRRLVRTWLLRGTLHLAAAEDAAWLLPLLAPALIEQGKRRLGQLGWDIESTTTGLRLLREVLEKQGSLTREQIIALLRQHNLPFEGQAAIHLIYRAALEGLLCGGPDRDSQPTYTLLEPWVGPLQTLPQPTAVEVLARRYLQAFAPAAVEDMARWSGLTLGVVHSALQSLEQELVPVEFDGRRAFLLETQIPWLDEIRQASPAERLPVVRLLPRFDLYLLGYAGREMVVEPAYARRIHPGGGIIRAALLVDGCALGTWKTKARRRALDVIIESFEPLPDELLPVIEAEVQRMGTYLGAAARMIVSE